MDVKSYCDTLERQLTTWKAKIYDVIRVVDTLHAGEKEKVFPSIRTLHAIVEEIDGQLEQLITACPADWSPNRQTIDAKMAELQQTLKKLSEKVGGPLIPDSLSWVSE
jgi:nitrogenase molybdenum-iron protein alpha/beta subunit